MILAGVILAGVLITGVATFWDDIVNWLQRAIDKVKKIINMAVVGTKIFVKKIKEAIQEISRHYSKDKRGQWHETVVTREVPESEVPDDIRAKARRTDETNITEELEMKLSS